ncbi:MAG: GFA family protein [Pseudomonadales bacterium]
MINGSCLCGGVRFEVQTITGPAEYCHCTRCRKVSGSSALLMIGIKTEGFRFVSGSELIQSFEAPILYDPPDYKHCFCSICGSSVPAPEGDWIEIPTGSLDDDPGLIPDKHIFVELLPEWDSISDGLPQYTVSELVKLRTGHDLRKDFQMKFHVLPSTDSSNAGD